MSNSTGITIKLNENLLKKLSESQITALVQTADALKTEVMNAQVVPHQSGELERSSNPVDDSKASQGIVRLVYDTPYARKLYFHPEYNFRKDKNPKAQGRWLEPWISGSKKKFCVNTFKEIYKRLTNI